MLRIVAVIGVTMLFVIGALIPFDIVSKAVTVDGAEWDVILNFAEPSGKSDYIIFGEATDASDGPPADRYDTPKAPLPPGTPFISVCLDNDLPIPYNTLMTDYREYPDIYKEWNFTVWWTGSDTTVSISWNITEVGNSEYDNVTLCNEVGSPLVDMLSNDNYSFFCPNSSITSFQIIATANNPPYTPRNPDPEDGGTVVDINADISWTGGDPNDGDIVTYDVYFDTDTPPSKKVSEQSRNSFDPGTLSYNTAYYWKIVAWDNHDASTSGPIWSFTTGSSSGNGGNGDNGGNGGNGGDTNQPPTANASASETFGFVGEQIIFNGTLSTDTDGYITNWSWDFGDNKTGNGEVTTHAYADLGTYTITLTVIDNYDATDNDTITVVITKANKAPTKPLVNGTMIGNKNIEYTYTAVSTDEDNDSLKYTFNWDDGNINESQFLPNGTVFTIKHSWNAAGKYTLTVTATDNKTDSSSEHIVLIDAVIVGNIGYLTDTNGDGVYDSFHDDVAGIETFVDKQDNETYLIDVDGDGSWDYYYDPIAETMTAVDKKETIATEEIQWGFIAMIVFALAIIAVIVYFYKKGYF